MKRILAAASLLAALHSPVGAQRLGVTVGVQDSEVLGAQALLGAGMRLGPLDLDIQGALFGDRTTYGSADLPIVYAGQQIGVLTVPTRRAYTTTALQAQATLRWGPLGAGPLAGFGELDYREYWIREDDDVKVDTEEHDLRYWGGVLTWEHHPLQVRFSVAWPNIESSRSTVLYGLALSVGR